MALVVSGAVAAGTGAALLAAAPAASAAEPAVAERGAKRPASLAEIVARLLRGEMPILVQPTTTTTAVAPEGGAAVAAPGAEVNLPVRPPPVTPPTVTPPTLSPPTTAPPAASSPARFTNSQSGVASWYNDRAGRCAHRTAPIGTVVTVTNLETGATVKCTVTNRGPYAAGRVIDLSDESFAAIAPLSQGLADVRVEW